MYGLHSLTQKPLPQMMAAYKSFMHSDATLHALASVAGHLVSRVRHTEAKFKCGKVT